MQYYLPVLTAHDKNKNNNNNNKNNKNKNTNKNKKYIIKLYLSFIKYSGARAKGERETRDGGGGAKGRDESMRVSC